MDFVFHVCVCVWGGGVHSSLLNSERLFVSSSPFLLLSLSFLWNSAIMLPHFLSFTALSLLTVPLNSTNACLHHSLPSSQDTPSQILSNSHYRLSLIFSLKYSGTPFPRLRFLFSMTWTYSKRGQQRQFNLYWTNFRIFSLIWKLLHMGTFKFF